MEQIKDCSIRLMYFTKTYPSYTSGLCCAPEGTPTTTCETTGAKDGDQMVHAPGIEIRSLLVQ